MLRFLSVSILFATCLPLYTQSTPKAEISAGFSYLNYEAASVNLPSGTETITESCPSSGSVVVCTSTVVGPTLVSFNPRIGMYGWNGSITAVLAPWFGFASDFDGNYRNETDSAATTLTTTTNATCTPAPCIPSGSSTTTATYRYTVSNPRIQTFLFGPQFVFPVGKVKGYARFLAGGMHRSIVAGEVFTSGNQTVAAVSSAPAGAAPSSNYFACAFGGGVDGPIRKGLSWRVGADYLTSTGAAQNHVRAVTALVWQVGR